MRKKKHNESLSLKDYNRIFYQRLNFNRDKNFLINLCFGVIKFFIFLIKKKSTIINSTKENLFIITTKNQFEVLSKTTKLSLNNSEVIMSLNNKDNLIKNSWEGFLGNKVLSIVSLKIKLKFLLNNPHAVRDLYYVIFTESIIDNISSYIRKSNFRNIIYASDHGLISSFFIVAIRNLNINSFDVQHGMVTDKFPELEANYFFSYGKYSSFCYQNKTNCKIIEVGRSYSVNNDFVNNSKENNRVGISINELDCEIKLEQVIKYIHKSFPEFEVIIKLHPSQDRNKFRKFNIYEGSLSNYFDTIDIHLSCESSIHLDSIFFKTPTFYANILHEKFMHNYDYYNFIKFGLIVDFIEIKTPFNYINDIEISKNYIANIETRIDPSIIINKYLTENV
jgi:hypothetical protein